jgi:hypothetical protein
MSTDNEIIAILLDDNDEDWPSVDFDLDSTSRLVRLPTGEMSLERLRSREELERTAETTGIFRRGKPILDPESGEIIGYELEQINDPKLAIA